ncbi:VOC family protein [Leifsonia sp. F6_8S_P_1B]|uniref:VOC family protein n=1 Tax=Leifsonia williamsii TaxID=3035919 RepID=A0ABT8K7P8_9MICO|nr:VOC family protein [Leifsonia williamsii]MDN4613461.1 VOC family protein [Leifsonia williamsii]
MSAIPVPHLNFHGVAREALEFYAEAFHGRAMVRTYADVGMPADAPGADRVVFGQVVGQDGFTVMAYDIPGATGPVITGFTTRENGVTITDQPFFLSLSAADLGDAQGWWEALAEGATVIEPLAASPWSAGFGMLADRFGVTWVINVMEVEAEPASA